jgi:hypothetical protein
LTLPHATTCSSPQVTYLPSEPPIHLTRASAHSLHASLPRNRLLCPYSRLFFAVAWTPKATVQAVLSGTPLHLVKILKSGAPDYDQWLQWGHEIQTTGERFPFSPSRALPLELRPSFVDK